MWPQPGLPHPDGGSCTLSSHSLPTSLKHISVIITHSSKTFHGSVLSQTRVQAGEPLKAFCD